MLASADPTVPVPRTVRILLAPILLCLATSACLGFHPATPPELPAPAALGAVTILDAFLADRIERLEQHSSSFGDAMRELRRGNTPLLVGTPEQLARLLGAPWNPPRSAYPRAGDSWLLPPDSASPTPVLVVSVNLTALKDAYRTHVLRELPLLRPRSRLQERFNADVDAVLIHEIWGHVVPVAHSGSTSGTCSDPLRGRHEAETCAVQREAVVRGDLGLPPRGTYGLRF